jgi:transcriptional regulator with XRE-family HTH domain
VDSQLKLPMLTYYEGPKLVDPEIVRACRSYREAVRAAWHFRTRRNLTRRALAEGAGLYASHVSDYLSDDESKRELPARHIEDFEQECGNRFVSQWLAQRANLTILEQFMERRAA